jgi:hypothetical protein
MWRVQFYFQNLTKFGCNGNVRWIARPWLQLRPCQWRPDVRVTAPRGQDVNPASVCPGLVLQGHDPYWWRGGLHLVFRTAELLNGLAHPTVMGFRRVAHLTRVPLRFCGFRPIISVQVGFWDFL